MVELLRILFQCSKEIKVALGRATYSLSEFASKDNGKNGRKILILSEFAEGKNFVYHSTVLTKDN